MLFSKTAHSYITLEGAEYDGMIEILDVPVIIFYGESTNKPEINYSPGLPGVDQSYQPVFSRSLYHKDYGDDGAFPSEY